VTARVSSLRGDLLYARSGRYFGALWLRGLGSKRHRGALSAISGRYAVF